VNHSQTFMSANSDGDCMKIYHLLGNCTGNSNCHHLLSCLKKVCIIYHIVKFTTSSHAVIALSVRTVGTMWWQGYYTFTFSLRKIWQLPTYILMFIHVSVISKPPKHTSCTSHICTCTCTYVQVHTHYLHSMVFKATCRVCV
jgi:hypothetical protein